MSELDPILLRGFAAARAERPASADGKARALASLGLGAAAATASKSAKGADASSPSVREPPEPAAGVRRLRRLPWWSLLVGIIVVGGTARVFLAASPRIAPKVADAPSAATSPEAAREPAKVAAAMSESLAPAAPALAPMLAVDELPTARDDRGATPSGKVAAVAPCAACNAAPSAPTSIASAPTPASKGPSLREEVEALARASSALSERQCAKARQALSEYRTRFPNGRLEREADVVDIEIVGRAGDGEKARVAARRFVSRFPDSPYAMRLAPWLRDDGDATHVVRCVDAIP